MGTRGGAGRLFGMALALAAGLFLALAQAARAGDYTVVQCGWGAGFDAEWIGPGSPGMRQVARCDQAANGGEVPLLGVSVDAGSMLAPGAFAGWRWSMPPGVRPAELSAADWTMLHDGLVSRIGWVDAAGGFHSAREDVGFSLGTTRIEVRFPLGGGAVEQRMVCADFLGRPCAIGGLAWAELSQLLMTLEDEGAPVATLAGGLVGAGWRRATVSGAVAASDAGSGVRRAEVQIDGAAAGGGELPCATATVEGRVLGARLRPCPLDASPPVAIDTTALADGPHEVRACAVDFSGAVGCSASNRLLVDNTPPLVAFDAATSVRSGRVMAEVSDPTSGPVAGTISYRDVAGGPWTELPTELRRTGGGAAALVAGGPDRPAGTKLLFRAEARDAAGNLGSSVLRADGSSSTSGGTDGRGGHRGGKGSGRGTHLLAWFVGGSGGGHPAALTVGFGRDAVVRGRLTDSRGSGVGGERLRVSGRPDRGGTARTATERAITGRDGAFSLHLPPGTSRLVSVSFSGGDGLAAARSRPLHLKVRAGVSFRAEPTELRTGETVAFSGKVRRDAAAVPSAGKLVAIQYLEQATNRWRPVIVVHSDRSGAFHARYRFRYITGSARIRLRATVPPEERWPYAAGASRPVIVRVRG